MSVESEIEAVISGVVTIAVVIFLFYIFYVTPSPIQQFFQNTVNQIIFDFAIAFIAVIVIIIIYYWLSNRD